MPQTIVLSHLEQYDRLVAAVPQAADAAVVAGDPCFDRLLASAHNRTRYRRALGVHDDRTIVTVSSTWGPRSLLGSQPELIGQLAAELELDDYAIAVVLHPNTWFAHGPAQIRLWLGDCLRSGVRLVPPDRGWQQTLVAADIVIGDNGAVTGYAAAIGVPTLLGAFAHHDVVPTSAIDALGQSARRLDLHRPFPEQLHQASTSTSNASHVLCLLERVGKACGVAT